MTDLDTADVSGRTITAFFELRQKAEHTVRELVAAGISKEGISIAEGDAPPAEEVEPSTGLLASVKDVFMSEHDRKGRTEGETRSGFVMSVAVDDAHRARAVEILTRDGATDIDEGDVSGR